MLAQAEYTFDTFECIWGDHKSIFFVTVWPPGGAIITFAENWNFELIYFLVNYFRDKMIQLKITIASKSHDDATWWPNSYKKIWLVVNSEILKGIKNMFGLFEHFF